MNNISKFAINFHIKSVSNVLVTDKYTASLQYHASLLTTKQKRSNYKILSSKEKFFRVIPSIFTHVQQILKSF